MKKIFLCLGLLAFAALGKSQDLVPFQAPDKLYGYKDAAGNVVVPAKYSVAMPFHEGLAVVIVRGRYGFIAPDGKVVVPLKYTSAKAFKGGVAIAKLDTQPLLLNRQGEEIVKPGTYTQIQFFSEGLAAVSVGGQPETGMGGKWGYINSRGELVIAADLDLATMFQNGKAWVKRGGKHFHIDPAGKPVK